MKRCLTVSLFAALVFVGALPSGAQDRTRKPNIVFILADDLGYTDVGCFGSRYYETPNIDRLAAQGMRFTDGYTCGPNCQPTRAALMSGQYGPRTGVYTVGGIDRFDWKSRPLRPVDNVTSLPLEKPQIWFSQGKAYIRGTFTAICLFHPDVLIVAAPSRSRNGARNGSSRRPIRS